VGLNAPSQRLEDLIDLEARLVLDEGADPDDLRRRDRAIGRRLPSGLSPSAALRAWLDQLRPSPSPGHRLAVGLRWVSALSVLIGGGLGWATATGLLAFREGGSPVNAGTFLGVTVLGQLGLLALAALFIPLSFAFPELPLIADGRRLLRWLSEIIARATGPLPEDWSRLRARLRARASLYGRAERWLFLEKTQLFMLAFNLGLIARCLQLVLFTDLAFGWSTSATSVDAAQVHRWTSALASPWAGWLPEAVPDPELIEKTRYYRLEGRYAAASGGRKGDPVVAAGWWPFLLMALVVYGFLPRFILWSGAAFLRRRSIARVPVASAQLQAVLRRLRSPMVRTQAEDDPVEASGSIKARVEAPRPEPGQAALLIRWRDHPSDEEEARARIESQFGWSVADSLVAGSADAGADERTASAASGRDVVVVLAEAWEAPDKSLVRLVARIRDGAGARVPIWFVLTGEDGASPPSTDQRRLWERRLALLEDPYLGVEVFGS